jgi:hypothetical protein
MSTHLAPGVMPGGTRLRRFAVLAAALAALGTAAAAPTEHAAAAAAGCPKAPKTWPAAPRLVVHLSELTASGGDFGSELLMLGQMGDAVNQLNSIGASSAQVAGIDTTTEPFLFGSSFPETEPAIHVGFASAAKITADAGKFAAGYTSPGIYMSASCEPTVTIEFPDLNAMSWAFNSPFALAAKGASYYDAGDKAPFVAGDTPVGANGGTWFRPSFLHELLHAFGLHHTSDEYSMMNHRGGNDPNGGFPWANRADADAVRPLPYEIGLLRTSYPASGTRWDVAALDTWFHVTSTSVGGAANQVKLCTPSLGSALSADQETSGPCGEGGRNGGSTKVKQGNRLRTRYALANYSTGSLKLTEQLWLSKDEQWLATDIPVAATRTETIPAATSRLVEASWKLPALTAGTRYHPIIHVFAEHVNADGSIDPGSLRLDWIPLRGLVCGKPCPDA